MKTKLIPLFALMALVASPKFAHSEVPLPELYEQVKDRAFTEGAFAREEWDSIVDDLLDSKREFEEISDDVDWAEIREALQAKYDDFEADIPEM